ncbi:zinc ribbon domain-containing protein [Adlercreutzia sp. ZJ141]|uniref:zinc ribbon domain-containing protein n=1 Tax=Adlercreutzia sp. ZJ141 TaxID=2709406 RepID=UPI001F14B89B|nr:zinc ribbon domain-containing protein [Adlercreutzia sp. ZJ141]
MNESMQSAVTNAAVDTSRPFDDDETSLGASIAKHRKLRGLTQEELARKLYVTRQAVSRWETGETMPGIDMLKLIAITLNVPIAHLLEAPASVDGYCQSCGMGFFGQPENHGTNADGTPSADYCTWCYQNGEYEREETMDDLIERCAPYMMESTHVSHDEAVSIMGAILPNLKRWKD